MNPSGLCCCPYFEVEPDEPWVTPFLITVGFACEFSLLKGQDAHLKGNEWSMNISAFLESHFYLVNSLFCSLLPSSTPS